MIACLHTCTTAGFECLSATDRGDKASPNTAGASRYDASRQLTDEEQRQVQQLKRRDQQVRAHERAHMAAGAGLVQGGARFAFEQGPDGRMYAVGGEVKIDTAAENDPDATIRKMEQIKRAALAPAEPSGADRAVAARASQVEAQARQEKNQPDQDELAALRETGGPDRDNPGTMSALPGRRPYHVASSGHSIDIAV